MIGSVPLLGAENVKGSTCHCDTEVDVATYS